MQETPTNLAEAIEYFLKDIGRGHSPATRNTYRVALNGFLQYLAHAPQASNSATDMAVTGLQTDWAVDFLRHRADGTSFGPETGEIIQSGDKASKATLATYAAALSRFYRWCMVERLLTLPAEEYERMQIRLKEIKGKERRTILSKVPPDEVVEALLQQVRKPRPVNVNEVTRPQGEIDRIKQELIRLRDIALLESLKCTGARVSELTNLTRGDLDSTNQRARAVGKGNKERWLYFSRAAWEALDKYLVARTRALNNNASQTKKEEVLTRSARRQASGRNYSSQPLFARHDRGASLDSVKPLTPRAVQRLIITLVEQAELDSNITPHKFRHWVATRLLSATGDLATTQDLLGHASPTTTRIYAQVSEQTKQNLHRQVFD
jgi:site-specific recombinase XerD